MREGIEPRETECFVVAERVNESQRQHRLSTDGRHNQGQCRRLESHLLSIQIGELADKHAYCKPLSDPAPEYKKLIPTGLVLNLWQYGSPNPEEPQRSQLRLRGLLPFLSRLGPCLEFSFAPEVAALADTPISLDKSLDRDMPILDAMSALLERLPQTTNG